MKIRTVRLLERSRLGLRGSFLLGLMMVDIGIGWGMLFPSAEVRAGSAYAWRSEFMPTELWGVIWIGVGLFLGTQAWSRRDRAAYAVAIMIKLVWATVAVGSWLLGPVAQGWQTAILFGGFAWLAFVASLMPEPIKSRTVTTMSVDPLDPDADL